VMLDDREHRSVYIGEGLAHGFLALQDDSTVMYLCSSEYSPGREHTVSPLDPSLGIEWPATVFGAEWVLSPRDRDAPTVAEARDAGVLPTWTACEAYVSELRAQLRD
jgi:dTDP-4-dehydrorhamnose 3,5-epimerase